MHMRGLAGNPARAVPCRNFASRASRSLHSCNALLFRTSHMSIRREAHATETSSKTRHRTPDGTLQTPDAHDQRNRGLWLRPSNHEEQMGCQTTNPKLPLPADTCQPIIYKGISISTRKAANYVRKD